MRAISINYIYDELFSLPNGVCVPWADLLKRAGDHSALMQSVAFGTPDSVMRNGNNFTARGKEAASMVRGNVTVHSEKLVTYTVKKVGSELQITNIKGVRVQLNLPLMPQLALEWVNVSVDREGNFIL